MRSCTFLAGSVLGLAALCLDSAALAQQVILPAPRLLTTMPMGGQAGSTFEVTITGESIDDSCDLLFSDPRITATPKLSADGKVEKNKFVVTIAPDAPLGVHEARFLSRLGVSSSRAFSVGALPEVTRDKPNTSLETALELKSNSVCNAATTARAIDHYSFQASQGQRTIVECVAAGIDSKLTPVLIIADAQGRDLRVERRGGILDFTAPADGKYYIKVHALTFQGGPEYYYRLVLLDAPGTGPIARQATTRSVSSISLPPDSKPGAVTAEVEPNNKHPEAQKISLPCDITGKFFPAADVDTFEFTAKKGDIWWIEVVSERLGLPTDPFVLVQRVTQEGGQEVLTDVAELNDIPSPVKLSSNGYAYDGVHYNAGSADALGKLEIKEDGVYRLQLRDLFGGTRTDPRNEYRLMIRKPVPDFALAAWAMHMNLRNGDRNAVSKPLALHPGRTVALDVAVVRKDGFDGQVDIDMEGLPAGVSACGLKIPAGKNQGTLLITAAEDAPRAFAVAKIFGRAQINGADVQRPCQLASMVWPVRDANQEIPRSRLLADVPVSVNGTEPAPVTVKASEQKVWEVKAGEKLTIPLQLTWRGEFSGAFKLKAMGPGFEGVKEFDVPLNAPTAQLELDLAALKTAPGEYALALYGGSVTKYRYNLAAVKAAEEEQKQAAAEVAELTAQAKQLATDAQAAPADKKAEAESAAKAAAEKQKGAEARKAEADKRLAAANAAAAPTDIADIVVSEPIRIVVKPADKT